jgi:hypothetical protein
MTTIAPAYLYQFGGVDIPGALGAFTWPGTARKRFVKTLSGPFDPTGGTAAGLDLPYDLGYTGLCVDATDTSAIADELDSLRDKIDTTDRLWLALADGTYRWAWAHLKAVAPELTATARAAVRFTLAFQVASPWYGDVHGGYTDLETGWHEDTYLFANHLYYDGPVDAFTIDSDPTVCFALNNGDAPVDDLGITIKAGSADITAVTLTSASGADWIFSGTIAAGNILRIDCGACTVLNDGVDAFDGLKTGAAHVLPSWLRATPGIGEIYITLTGGSTDSTIVFTLADGWR